MTLMNSKKLHVLCNMIFWNFTNNFSTHCLQFFFDFEFLYHIYFNKFDFIENTISSCFNKSYISVKMRKTAKAGSCIITKHVSENLTCEKLHFLHESALYQYGRWSPCFRTLYFTTIYYINKKLHSYPLKEFTCWLISFL